MASTRDKHDVANHDAAVQYARIRQILRDCRIAYLSDEELARIRLFYADAALHPKAHVPHVPSRSAPESCDTRHLATPLHIAA